MKVLSICAVLLMAFLFSVTSFAQQKVGYDLTQGKPLDFSEPPSIVYPVNEATSDGEPIETVTLSFSKIETAHSAEKVVRCSGLAWIVCIFLQDSEHDAHK